jgi:hypothetical protein
MYLHFQLPFKALIPHILVNILCRSIRPIVHSSDMNKGSVAAGMEHYFVVFKKLPTVRLIKSIKTGQFH